MPDPLDAARGLMAYIDASPSPFHAAANAATMLEAAGFQRLDPTHAWRTVGAGRFFMVDQGSLIAWSVPDGTPPAEGLRLIGAHTDSPNLRVKPRPDTGAVGWRQLGVEVYGSVLANSWLDRDLGVSGRVVLRSGDVRLVKIDRPLLRIPQLAIHLDRDVNDRGLTLDRQLHLTPVWGVGAPREGDFADLVAAELSVPAAELAAWELMAHDLTPAALLGAARDLLAASRLDNLCSCYAAVQALTSSDGQRAAFIALFDHEEVGSATTTGAGGPLLERVLRRSVVARGGGEDELDRALAASMLVSADMAHAVHPNYPERHEPSHRPLPNGGPVVKINAGQRYATTAVTAAAFIDACRRARVCHQIFVSRNNIACGSTIGPITAARLGIPTVDAGCPQLSMHSARELMGALDVGSFAAALSAFIS